MNTSLGKQRRNGSNTVKVFALMPNHFHFMLLANTAGCEKIFINNRLTDLQTLSKAIGNTLSSYTQAINRQNNTIGSLFQKKTKAKCLTDLPTDFSGFSPTDYLLNCFHYIHLNPLKAKLVHRLEDWRYSSWPTYANLRDDGLCSKKKALAVLGLANLTAQNYVCNEDVLQGIW